jgi:hypothetical protein
MRTQHLLRLLLNSTRAAQAGTSWRLPGDYSGCINSWSKCWGGLRLSERCSRVLVVYVLAVVSPLPTSLWTF